VIAFRGRRAVARNVDGQNAMDLFRSAEDEQKPVDSERSTGQKPVIVARDVHSARGFARPDEQCLVGNL